MYKYTTSKSFSNKNPQVYLKEAGTRVLKALNRKDIRQGKDEVSASISQLQQLTGMSRGGVINGITNLVEEKVIYKKIKRLKNRSFSTNTYIFLSKKTEYPPLVHLNEIPLVNLNENPKKKKTEKEKKKKKKQKKEIKKKNKEKENKHKKLAPVWEPAPRRVLFFSAYQKFKNALDPEDRELVEKYEKIKPHLVEKAKNKCAYIATGLRHGWLWEEVMKAEQKEIQQISQKAQEKEKEKIAYTNRILAEKYASLTTQTPIFLRDGKRISISADPNAMFISYHQNGTRSARAVSYLDKEFETILLKNVDQINKKPHKEYR